MIHYTCDLCKREIEPAHDQRYLVKLEIFAALDEVAEPIDDDRDNLVEIQSVLERMEHGADADVANEIYQTMRFDLCPECRAKFAKNPLGREAKQFDFSQN